MVHSRHAWLLPQVNWFSWKTLSYCRSEPHAPNFCTFHALIIKIMIINIVQYFSCIQKSKKLSTNCRKAHALIHHI